MIMDGIKTKNEGKGEDSLKSEKCRKRNFDIAFLTDQDQPKSQTFEKHSILAFETNNKSAFKKVLKEPSLATTSFCPTEKPDMSLYLKNISSLWFQPQESFIPFFNQSQLLSRPYQSLLGIPHTQPSLPFIRPKLKEEEDPLCIEAPQPALMPAVVPSVFGPSLISPALAALTMTTNQNVCAKCNLSFRMTSDLVYHMRSQHRPETDLEKLRRGEKLKCPVCGESFRERHHLTRHMTSHSNKEKITPPSYQ
ncbi:hypothetical protein QYM36_006473 [Artemia franciscana]|uniref:C2H2-type domain-containing protein n=1 Tax=Artemia franciscana TaxID=6661 RepID=A0AA88L9D5_ARTSF|nr:hypothetical protein QYM36_006473 [Artemia franciscana]